MSTPFTLMLATSSEGVHRLERGGDAWSATWHRTTAPANCVLVTVDGAVLVGTQGDGLHRSEDGGVSWRRSGLDNGIVKSLAVSPADPGVVYAGSKPAMVHRSADGGRTWEPCPSFDHIRGRRLWRQPAERPSTPYVQALAASPKEPDVVVAGIEAGAVVRSEDGGRTWSNHTAGACRDCHYLHFHPDGTHVYEGGGGVRKPGVALSADRGTTWSRPDDGLDINYGWAVAADPADPEIAYIALSPGAMKAHSDADAQAGLFRKDGSSWTRMTGGLPQPLDHMPYALITHPQTPNYVLAGLSDGQLWETFDRGESWAMLDTRFPAIHRAMAAA